MKSLSSNRASTSRRCGVPLTVTATAWRSVAMARALGCALQGAAREHAGEVALIILAGVDIAVRVERALGERRGRREIGSGHAPADQRARRLGREHRLVA